MRGLELSRNYYYEIIRPVISQNIDFLHGNYAVCLIGYGSDVIENDDEKSMDHEWGPRCIIFIPEELAERKDEIYDILNKNISNEFMGYPTRFKVSYDGAARVMSDDGSGDVNIDIHTCAEYFKTNLGIIIPKEDVEWLSIPENKLFEITKGEVFFDGFSELTRLRNFYKKYYPDNVYKYRLAYAWQTLGWDADLIGLCSERGDILSARCCLSETILRIIKLVYLLNRKYMPSYGKWISREFYKLPYLSKDIGPLLEECFLKENLKKSVKIISRVSHMLIDYENSALDLVRVDIRKNKFSRGYMDIDFQYIADTIYKSIDGNIKNVPLYGAVDQWVTNQDFLLDAEKIKRLSVIYKR